MIGYLEQGHIINGTYYADELSQEIARKRSGKRTLGVFSCMTMRQITQLKLRWLLQLTAALKFFPISNILRTFTCFRN
jgi:hypothetical protein